MKITTEIMQVIVNQKQIDNSDLINMIMNVAKINNISIEYVSSNIDEFLRSIIQSIQSTTLEIIETAKNDKLLNK